MSERPSDLVERTVIVRRDTWSKVIAMCDELRAARSVDASGEEVAGILLSEAIDRARDERARQGTRKGRARQ